MNNSIFIDCRGGRAEFQYTLYLQALKRHIHSKFDSPNYHNIRDIGVHTDRNWQNRLVLKNEY